MKVFCTLVFLCSFAFSVISQNCPEISDAKAKKLVGKAFEKKYEFEERQDFLKRAIEIEPDYAEAYNEMGMIKVTLSKINGEGITAAEKYFKKAIELCPGKFCYAYFYLATINLGKENYGDAATYFAEFLKSEDNSKKTEDIEKAEKNLPICIGLDKLYKNPVPFEPTVIKEICSYEDEFLPMLSPDNELIFFTKRYNKQTRDLVYARQVEELTQSTKVDGKFAAPKELLRPFNLSGDGYGGVTFSLDNTQLYITVCKLNKRGQNNCDIYYSEFIKGNWSELKSVGDGINTTDGWESQPTLSSDGKTLIFASARADSKGMDLYMSKKNEDGSWGMAENLGSPINTEGNDKSPFLHSDSKTLYFSSDGHVGLGGYDIFYSKSGDSDKFLKPTNIGYPINSNKDDVGFFVSTDGKFGYFSSNQLKEKGLGGYDIFSFELYKEARPEKIIFLKGTLTNEDKTKPLNAVIEIKSVDSKKVTKINVDTVSGNFIGVHTIKENEDVVVTVKQEGKAFTSQYISYKEETAGKPLKMDMESKKIEANKAFTINNIQYKSNSAELTNGSKAILEEFVSFLKDNASINIEIRGHTDNIGNPIANMALSTDRAFTVFDFLGKSGIEKGRISFKGYGDTKPIKENTTEQGRMANRRTEFFITKN
jgi:outer membrane protein OmpA-like peptidoglycan-associated protein/tetratricopeptide (TPR) repeat protein